MARTHDRYSEMRRFEATPEPRPEPRRSHRKSAHCSADTLQFVVQKHAASHLHYDFRLELDGALKSWAIPKGPSLDPLDKRMAIHVEDHPLGYADFEGVIPPGNYGAGTVIVWDRGIWIPSEDAEKGYEQGKLKFELRGSKLRGHWTLVRTRRYSGKSESWLLIKERDDAARDASQFNILEAMPNSVLNTRHEPRPTVATARHLKSKMQSKRSRRASAGEAKRIALPAHAFEAPQPLSIAPQLATLLKTPPQGDWLYEVKFDGYRLLSRLRASGDIHLFTRNGNDWTPKLRSLQHALAQLDLGPVWLDGEIVVSDGNGVPNFQMLQNAFEVGAEQTIHYCVFDILYYHGYDLRASPLRERREFLRKLLPTSTTSPVQFSENFAIPIGQLLRAACRMSLEGVIGKRADSPYTSARSPDWIKLKCNLRQEFVIVGFTDSGANDRSIGALLLGVHTEGGKLRYAGKVGTGFTRQSMLELRRKLVPLTTARAPIDLAKASVELAHWVKPKLLAQIEFSQWTEGGLIRHASFQGLRDDKPARAIIREEPADADENDTMTTTANSPRSRRAETKISMISGEHNDIKLAGVRISHPERVIDAQSGTTKLQLAQYYSGVANALLPHLRARPVSLVRAPNGVGGELFFQKHMESLRRAAIKELDTALLPDHPPLLEIASRNALIGCAQMNVIEFHTWNATTRHIEQPDRMLFDLDPGAGIEWQQMREAASLMRELLDQLQLRSFIKTSGGKGLHIVVPLKPQADWETVKSFSAAVARHMATTLPQIFVAKSGPANRVERIFIDYLRNTRGATTVAAFCARARPGLGISMPFAWDELETISGGAHWRIDNVDAEVVARQQQSWRGYSTVRQTLARALQRLPKAR